MSALVLVVGIGNLLVGAAYAALGLLSAWEAVSQYRYRGLSRFGLGFTAMAASCGPHHLVHGWCVLQGGTVTQPMLVATLVGLPAGVTFCWLRVEAMLGQRGDRTITGALPAVAGLTAAYVVAVGALSFWALTVPSSPREAICTAAGIRYLPAEGGTRFGSLVLFANLFVTVTYLMVGWYLAATQLQRWIATRRWSLSGLALTAVFPTCALMHLIHGLAFGAHSPTLAIDLLGVPASIWFLYVVRQLHRDSLVDWNRRPLAGVAAAPDRDSPWSPAAPSALP